MPNPNRRGSHTLTRLTVHVVWVTKYRYHVLKGDVQKRCRELLIQICDSEDIQILKGAVSVDHVHMHIEYPPKLSISDIMKRFKKVLIPELNLGQLRTIIRANYLIDAIGLNKVQGKPFSVGELVEKIDGMLSVK